MFEDLDKSNVSTGYLLDQAVDLINIRTRGEHDSNILTTAMFRLLLLRIWLR